MAVRSKFAKKLDNGFSQILKLVVEPITPLNKGCEVFWKTRVCDLFECIAVGLFGGKRVGQAGDGGRDVEVKIPQIIIFKESENSNFKNYCAKDKGEHEDEQSEQFILRHFRCRPHLSN